ncbi:MAG: peroxiredoxin [Halobaculum sp.]
MLDTGADAPSFELPNQNGKPVSLAEYAGQRVVLYFYPRADTPGCTREAKGFRDSLAEFAERDVAVIGISDDPVEALDDFADKYDLGFTLLSDEDGEVATAYDSFGERDLGEQTVEIAFRNTYVIGPDGKIERAYEGVSPDGHATEVLADLDELAGN